MSKASRATETRRELDRKFAASELTPIRTRPRGGWIKAVRTGLGMTARNLGNRLGATSSAISQLERAEANDAITIKKLREIAASMECELIYALVPRGTLDEIVDRRAREVARSQLARIHQTMKLEDQAVFDDQTERRIRDFASQLIEYNRIWDEP